MCIYIKKKLITRFVGGVRRANCVCRATPNRFEGKTKKKKRKGLRFIRNVIFCTICVRTQSSRAARGAALERWRRRVFLAETRNGRQRFTRVYIYIIKTRRVAKKLINEAVFVCRFVLVFFIFSWKTTLTVGKERVFRRNKKKKKNRVAASRTATVDRPRSKCVSWPVTATHLMKKKKKTVNFVRILLYIYRRLCFYPTTLYKTDVYVYNIYTCAYKKKLKHSNDWRQ